MRLLAALRSWILGTLLGLSAAGSVLLLGWLMRLMRGRAVSAVGQAPRTAPVSWVMGPRGAGWLGRPLGGLGANLREGVAAAAAVLVATFPFAGFWLASWWAGWDNSFNKGYEQAFVGPLVGLAGVGVFAVIMLYLPMAIAHQAVEARAWSLFELRRVRSAVRHTGWGYVIWTAAMLVAALPLFAVRGLPVFAEGIWPGLTTASPDQIEAVRLSIHLGAAAYLMVALVVLKGWSAAIYARAAARAAAGRDAPLWQGAAIAPGSDGRRRWMAFRWLRGGLMLAMWVAFAFVIYFGQFLNHNWWLWLSHPLIFLPWLP